MHMALQARVIGDLVGVSFARDVAPLEALGLDACELFQQTDAALTSLAEKLGFGSRHRSALLPHGPPRVARS